MQGLLKIIRETKQNITFIIRHILLKNKTISIISNNCWGGFMYKSCKIKYQSPFIGLFIFAPDYIELLKELKLNLTNTNIKFIRKEESKYKHEIIDKYYPIGILNSKFELHFLHYKTEEEALMKWEERVKRIDFNNLIIKFCDRDLCTPDLIKDFDNLELPNKVCFTSIPYPEYESVCFLKEFEGEESVNYCWTISDKYWNFVTHANHIKNH